MKEWLKAESPNDVAAFYDQKYKAAGKEAFTGAKYPFFFETFIDIFGRSRPTDRLMDCGCGHGEFFENVLSKFKFSSPFMTGIDVSAEALALAEIKFRNYEYQFNFFRWSMDHLKSYATQDFFDVVTSWGSIEHSFDPLNALRGMLHVVKAGGLVMITAPLEFDGCLDHIEKEPFSRNNERFMTYEEWYAYFSQVKKPIMTRKVEEPDMADLFMVFRK